MILSTYRSFTNNFTNNFSRVNHWNKFWSEFEVVDFKSRILLNLTSILTAMWIYKLEIWIQFQITWSTWLNLRSISLFLKSTLINFNSRFDHMWQCCLISKSKSILKDTDIGVSSVKWFLWTLRLIYYLSLGDSYWVCGLFWNQFEVNLKVNFEINFSNKVDVGLFQVYKLTFDFTEKVWLKVNFELSTFLQRSNLGSGLNNFRFRVNFDFVIEPDGILSLKSI